MSDSPQKAKGSGSPRLRVAMVMAILTTGLFVTVLYDDLALLADAEASDVPTDLIVRYAIAMALGGAASGFVLGGHFGRAGVFGWIRAFLAGVLASLLAGLAGSLIGLLPERLADGWQIGDLLAVLAGTFILPFALNDWPALILVWLGLIFVAHLWVQKSRQGA